MNRREVTLNGTTFPLNGANATSITTATYPISDIEDLIFVNTTSNLVALTLPNPASVAGRSVTIKKTNVGANGITVAAYSAENIEGAAGPYTLPNSDTAARGTWTLASDGTNWWLASTANTATSSSGTFAGKCVAGGLVNGTTGAVSNAFGGFAYASGGNSSPVNFTYTALGASWIAAGTASPYTVVWSYSSTPDDVPVYGFVHTGNGTCQVIRDNAADSAIPTGPDYQVLIFAAPV